MPKTPKPSLELIVKVLQLCTKDPFIRRGVERGSLHEDMVLVGLGEIAAEAGIPVKMVKLTASNYPLHLRDEVGQKPADYDYYTTYFLGAGKRLLRLNVENRPNGRTALKVGNYSPTKVLAVQDAKGFSALADSDEPMADSKGRDMVQSVLHEHNLEAEFEASQLESSTPEVQPRSKGPRL